MADSNLYECQPPLHFVPLFSWQPSTVMAKEKEVAVHPKAPIRCTGFTSTYKGLPAIDTN
jgi:hypothetical protein